jgi:acyl-CoA dehydrogenase
VVDQIFDVMVRDFSKFALLLYSKASSTRRQRILCHQMIRKPAKNLERYERVWSNHVFPLREAYEMSRGPSA